MSDSRVFGAVDLGASGGRVIAGVVDGDRVDLVEIHRFPNAAVAIDGHLRWKIDVLFGEVLVGLAKLASRYPQVESIGIDTWAVDYGLLGMAGELLEDPIAYRDGRTAASVAWVHDRVDPAELFAINGLQFLPFNTIYQLAAERQSSRWSSTRRVVLLPDLIAYWLTGELGTEATNASTTGLVDVRTGAWSDPLLDLLGIDSGLLPRIERSGTVRGEVLPERCAELGLRPGTVVTTVGSHDTASAVVALPATDRSFAYIASGTWSLVGLELDGPVLTTDARTANFTNEGGVDGRTRFLRNVGGLWLLQESMREWAEQGRAVDLEGVIADAAAIATGGPEFDVDDDSFIPPGDMPHRIAVRAGDPTLADDPPRLARCVIDSLAGAYVRTIAAASRLADRPVEIIHVVGGGAQNHLLCQQTADRSGLPVTAGPVEATALGNVLIQARAHGAAPSTLKGLRSLVEQRDVIRTHFPKHDMETRS